MGRPFHRKSPQRFTLDQLGDVFLNACSLVLLVVAASMDWCVSSRLWSLLFRSLITSEMIGMPRSLWSVSLDTYHGAFVIALSNASWISGGCRTQQLTSFDTLSSSDPSAHSTRVGRKNSGSGLENRDYGSRVSVALTTRHPSIRKSWH
jgi:hypothetical protein